MDTETEIFRGESLYPSTPFALPKTIDKIFDFKKARIVYRKFTKFEIGETDETRILHLIRLDAIISDAIDSLKQSIHVAEQLIGEDQRTTCVNYVSRTNKMVDESKTISCGGGRSTQESAGRLKNLRPITSSQLLSYCKTPFVSAIQQDEASCLNNYVPYLHINQNESDQ